MHNETSISTHYQFSTIMPVRITDINYGMHLGHTAIIGMFHNARVLFLNANNFNEMNIDGTGFVLINSQYSFKSEGFFNTNVIINVSIINHSKTKINFEYRATNQESNIVIAEGNEEFACFDYNKRKVVKIPDIFLNFCESKRLV